MEQANRHLKFQQALGIASTLVVVGMAGTAAEAEEFLDFPLERLTIIVALGCIGGVFLASAFWLRLGPAQPILLFLLAAFGAWRGFDSLDGLGFDLAAAVTLTRQGWFCRFPLARGAIAAIVGAAMIILPAYARGSGALAPVCLTAVYVGATLALARGRLLAAWTPKKRQLRLTDYKLSPREREIVRLRLCGNTVKEIAYDRGLAESTVRNKLSYAYRKLGLECAEDLAALGERFTII